MKYSGRCRQSRLQWLQCVAPPSSSAEAVTRLTTSTAAIAAGSHEPRGVPAEREVDACADDAGYGREEHDDRVPAATDPPPVEHAPPDITSSVAWARREQGQGDDGGRGSADGVSSGGVARIDFRDLRRIIPNASTSCGRQGLSRSWTAPRRSSRGCTARSTRSTAAGAGSTNGFSGRRPLNACAVGWRV